MTGQGRRARPVGLAGPQLRLAPDQSLVSAGTASRTSAGPGPHAAAVTLAALAVLHATWGLGSSWPACDKRALTAQAIGAASFPGPSACFAVAGLLTTAAAVVCGHPRRAPSLSRAASASVVAVLTIRGALGLAGRTDLVSPGSTGAQFRRADRRLYSPLCLALAGLALPAATPRRRGSAAAA